MAMWVLKGGRTGEREQRMLDKSTVGLGYQEMPDLSSFADRDALEAGYRRIFPDAGDGRVASHIGQLWSFVRTAKTGELVVVPLKTRSSIAIGELSDIYAYRTDLGPDMVHTRPVKWLNTDIPRSRFDQDLLYTFGAFLGFCRAERNNAEERIRNLLRTPSQEPSRDVPKARTDEDDLVLLQDIEQRARDQILDFMSKKFRGHDLARLVDDLLRAQDLTTRLSAPGPDGGVDIVAASGPLGMDSPRLCVQVKSSDAAADVNVFRGLKGSMDSYRAEQGLLVAWGGFTNAVRREADTAFFRVRLWDAGDLLNAILANYDRLSEAIQAELPLKRIWAMAVSEEEA